MTPTPDPRDAGAAGFAERVVAWQRAHGRHDLPWQRTGDAYRVWVSEVMLQQTQVAAVRPYYERFIAAFPDVATLAAAHEDSVLAHWSGLGYYRRARQLHAAARCVMERHGGAVPQSIDALVSLPGIGRSTAAAIASLAHGTRAALHDGNLKRVLARHNAIAGYPGAPAVEARLWRIAEALLPPRDAAAYTQGLMDLGATVCMRNRPRCGACPVADDCRARLEARVHELPHARPARVLPQRSLQVLLIEHAGAVLVERRSARGVWRGLWSLPELASDDDVQAHCHARFGHAPAHVQRWGAVQHAFTHYRLTMQPVHVLLEMRPAPVPDARWLAPADVDRAALPAPIRTLIEALRAPALFA